MAVLVYSDILQRIKDAVVANVSTDAPLDSNEYDRAINNAYQFVWEAEGPSIKKVASATAWTSAQLATGVVTGILTDVKEVQTVWASTTSGSTGASSGDYALRHVEYNRVQWLRGSNTTGTYAGPKVYSVTRLATATPASVGLLQLDYWPGVTGFYLPMAYVPQFTPIDSATVTTPDVSDIGSRDIVWIAASNVAQWIGRPDLVPGLLLNVSEGTAKLMERKARALLTGAQDS